jgi:hypothetical protein
MNRSVTFKEQNPHKLVLMINDPKEDLVIFYRSIFLHMERGRFATLMSQGCIWRDTVMHMFFC